MVYTKKAISPVVATALLLVVAVVAVVGFQSWFTTYQSGVNTQVEQNSASGSALTVERLEVNGTVYVKNTATEDISVKGASTKITLANGSDTVCAFGDKDAVAQSVTAMGNGGCTYTITKGAKYDVVLVTSDGVFTSTQIAR